MPEDVKMSPQLAAGELHRLINGFQVSQAIYVAAVLGVADCMDATPRASDEIAEAVGAHSGALYRLLRALAAIGVLREDGARRFSLTAMGECLRSDAVQPMRPFATFIGQAYLWQAWGHLLHSVKTGENAFRGLHDMDIWAYREQHPEQNAIFNAAMTGNSRRVDQAVVAAYDFSRFERIADIGGGQGSLLAAILAANPAARGVLFDLPHVVSTAAPVLAAAGVDTRCKVVGGSMFEAVPDGCAAYVMKFIIHDWDDADCVRILQVCRRAMPSDAKLLVIERLVGSPNEDPAVKFSDLHMLIGPGGQERTREEFAALFRAGGLRLADVVVTSAPVTVIVGEPL
jgi:hypothetical protein